MDLDLPIVELRFSEHKGKEIIQVIFSRNEELQCLLRSRTLLKWSKTMSCWYLPFSEHEKRNLLLLLKDRVLINDHCVNKSIKMREQHSANEAEGLPMVIHSQASSTLPNVFKEIEGFKNWMRSKRYSESTIGTYSDAIKVFLRYYSSKAISDITNDDVILFNNQYILANRLSASYQNQVVNAIKLFFGTVGGKKIDAELVHRPKRQKTLPNVLSKEEVKSILIAHTNMKHKVMLSLIYGCGLRSGELLRLKPEHVDSKRSILLIKQSKGRKDRIAPLSVKIIELLREYYIAAKPKVYLFEGQIEGEPYDARSLQLVLKQSLKKAGISKPVSLHWLRHSYATHLLEGGTDLRYIQEILGHSSSKTTEIYTHVSTKNIQKIVSPFDYL